MLTGAVLAGGQSRRFGANKAFYVWRGQRLVDRVVASLRPLCDPVLLIVNDVLLYADVQTARVRDVIPGQGPLMGLYTALLFSPHEWVLVRAVDMPCLKPPLVQAMLEHRRNADAVVLLREGYYEPLFALYHVRCMASIANLLEDGRRKVTDFYPRVRIKKLDENHWKTYDPKGSCFWNINRLSDVEELARDLREAAPNGK